MGLHHRWDASPAHSTIHTHLMQIFIARKFPNNQLTYKYIFGKIENPHKHRPLSCIKGLSRRSSTKCKWCMLSYWPPMKITTPSPSCSLDIQSNYWNSFCYALRTFGFEMKTWIWDIGLEWQLSFFLFFLLFLFRFIKQLRNMAP